MTISELERLTEEQNLALGLLSGVSCKIVNYPLLNIKNHVQQGVPIPTNLLRLYQGLPMACFNLGSTTALSFGFTGYLTKISGGDILLGSFLGGTFSAVPCSVWELTMIQQQRFGGSLVVWELTLGVMTLH